MVCLVDLQPAGESSDGNEASTDINSLKQETLSRVQRARFCETGSRDATDTLQTGSTLESKRATSPRQEEQAELSSGGCMKVRKP